MEKVGLVFYQIYIHNRGKPKQSHVVDSIPHKEKDLLAVVDTFFKSHLPKYEATQIDVKSKEFSQRVFVEDDYKLTVRNIDGTLRHGDEGYSSSLFDKKTGKKSFDRLPQHVELMPFVFLGDFTSGKKSAIMCFQTFGIHSVAGKVTDMLQSFLQKIYEPDLMIKINVIQVGAVAIKKYIKDGKVKNIIATKYVPVKDIADDGCEDVRYEANISPNKRGIGFRKSLNKIFSDYLDKKVSSDKAFFKSVGDLISVDLSDFRDMECIIDLNGVKRKIDIKDISKSATKFDVSENVVEGNNGHPTKLSVELAAKEIISNSIRKLISS